MTEHDHRVCPRCGGPAGGYRFCDACRAHMESSSPPATHAGVQASAAQTATRPAADAAGDPAAQARLAVLRLEQALAAASQRSSDRTGAQGPAATVDVEEDLPLPATETRPASSENVAVPVRLDGPSDTGRRPREVARFEDLLTVLPARDRERPAAAAPATASPDVETTVETPRNAASPTAAPFAAVANLPISAEEYLSGVTEPAAVQAEAPTGTPRAAEAPASEPTYVEAQLLREAFWFEHAAALGSIDDVEAGKALAPRAGDRHASDSAPPPRQASQANWLSALCFAALVAVLIALTGRSPRR